MSSNLRKFFTRLGLASVATVLVYVVTAYTLGAISVNRDFQQSQDGIPIYLRSNGVHTDLLLPTRTLNDVCLVEHFQEKLDGAEYVGVGWGHRRTYLEAPRWEDLTLTTALSAAFGIGGTVNHVTLERRPKLSSRCRLVRISPEQLELLIEFVRESFRTDTEGKVLPVKGAHYHQFDAFYEAHGTYSLLYNCNVWTGEALDHAGIRTGMWTPFSSSVLGHFQ